MLTGNLCSCPVSLDWCHISDPCVQKGNSLFIIWSSEAKHILLLQKNLILQKYSRWAILKPYSFIISEISIFKNSNETQISISFDENHILNCPCAVLSTSLKRQIYVMFGLASHNWGTLPKHSDAPQCPFSTMEVIYILIPQSHESTILKLMSRWHCHLDRKLQKSFCLHEVLSASMQLK